MASAAVSNNGGCRIYYYIRRYDWVTVTLDDNSRRSVRLEIPIKLDDFKNFMRKLAVDDDLSGVTAIRCAQSKEIYKDILDSKQTTYNKVKEDIKEVLTAKPGVPPKGHHPQALTLSAEVRVCLNSYLDFLDGRASDKARDARVFSGKINPDHLYPSSYYKL